MTAPVGLVVCGAPLAARALDVARALVTEEWPLTIGLSEAGAEWISAEDLGEATEQPAGTRPRRPCEKRLLSRPDRLVGLPLTFNTANKVAAGVIDNRVTGMLCDALGSGAAIVVTLMVNDRLWRHPAWQARWLDSATPACSSWIRRPATSAHRFRSHPVSVTRSCATSTPRGSSTPSRRCPRAEIARTRCLSRCQGWSMVPVESRFSLRALALGVVLIN